MLTTCLAAANCHADNVHQLQFGSSTKLAFFFLTNGQLSWFFLICYVDGSKKAIYFLWC